MNSSSPTFDVSRLEHVPRRCWGRYTGAVLILLVLVLLVIAFARGAIEWHYAGHFFTARMILEGLLNTVIMGVLAMALGIALGIVTAIMRLSTNPVLSWTARGYTWLFRGTR